MKSVQEEDSRSCNVLNNLPDADVAPESRQTAVAALSGDQEQSHIVVAHQSYSRNVEIMYGYKDATSSSIRALRLMTAPS